MTEIITKRGDLTLMHDYFGYEFPIKLAIVFNFNKIYNVHYVSYNKERSCADVYGNLVQEHIVAIFKIKEKCHN